jgi:hypothetical protein
MRVRGGPGTFTAPPLRDDPGHRLVEGPAVLVLDLIVAVGGHEHEAPEFLDHLPTDVRQRVAGTF